MPAKKMEGNSKKNFNLLSICLGNLLGLEEGLSRKQKGAIAIK